MIKVSDIHPEASLLLAETLEGKGDLSIDVMTVIIKNSSPLIFYFPIGPVRLQEPKEGSWKYLTKAPRHGTVSTFLCLVRFSRGFKRLMPIGLIEESDCLSQAASQSRRWVAELNRLGPTQFGLKCLK